MPVFTKKENATLGQRIEILDWYHANDENQSKTAKHFDEIYPNLRIKQPLVSAWVKEEERWREEWACSGARTAKRVRQTQMEETTNEEICQAVLAACNSQDKEPMGDDVEDDAVMEPHPTYREVLQAATVITRYVEHINDPVARNLEAILASFGRRMRLERSQALTSTHITDYFHHI